VAHDRVLGLPLRDVPAPGEPRFVADYLAEQPIARAGVAVDADLRAEGAENVLVAGAALPGAVPWRELSGEGIALASGYHAAGVVLAHAGASAGAAA
jgi:anaerobic glycerol-3-phosphate dehydrogenase